MLMLTGDLGGTDWPKIEFGAYPWEDPELFRRESPLTYAPNIRTPLLIQHAEQDLRTTIGQAEVLFTVLRTHRRPVRIMRVPGEIPRADPLRHAVPARGEPRPGPRLVRPLPGRGQADAAADAADAPRRVATLGPGGPRVRGGRRARPRRYPHRPMTTPDRPDTLTRERASELVRAWAGGRPGRSGRCSVA